MLVIAGMSQVLADQKSLHLLQQSLSAKEHTYVDMRAQGAPAYVAAKSAGFADPADHALTLERDPRIRSAIEYTLRAQRHQRQLTRDDVLNGFLEADAMAATAAEKVMAWKEIGKVIGAYAPTEIAIGQGDPSQKVKKLSDHELAKMAAIDADFVELTDE